MHALPQGCAEQYMCTVRPALSSAKEASVDSKELEDLEASFMSEGGAKMLCSHGHAPRVS